MRVTEYIHSLLTGPFQEGGAVRGGGECGDISSTAHVLSIESSSRSCRRNAMGIALRQEWRPAHWGYDRSQRIKCNILLVSCQAFPG